VQVERDPVLGEALYGARLRSGARAYVLPKPGFAKSFATFSTRYGSIDRVFVPPGATAPVEVPDGIAHFLEHQLFEEEDGNAADRFAAIGADDNAFTTFGQTTYLFSATDAFRDGVDILLDFVQHPHFTERGVEKEKGIIEQEIRMRLDDPGTRAFHNLTRALFQAHPVRLPVEGSVESIRAITTDLLETCYATFYHPENMVFFAVGDLDPEELIRYVDERITPRAGSPPLKRLYPEEPRTVASAWVEERAVVARPVLVVGVKETSLGREGYLRREVETGLLLDLLYGRSSPWYQAAYADGLIDDRFAAYYFGGPDFAASMIGGETADPHALRERIEARARELAETGIDAAAFERLRRKAMGEFVALFDAPEAIAHAFVDGIFKDVSLFDLRATLAAVRREDLERRLREHFVPEAIAASAILPAGA
jgi:predicted Zn-dependent peptidase